MVDAQQFLQIIEKIWCPDGVAKGLGPCRNCMLRAAVTIHHITPRSVAPERVYDIENVLPLCHICHEWADTAGKAGRNELYLIVKKRLDKKVRKL